METQLESKEKIEGEESRKESSKKENTNRGEYIYNLSRIPLNSNEIKVIDKGLKFAPTNNLNKFETYVNIQKYMRKHNNTA